MENDLVVIIMAGGLGTRMESDIPKVLHKIGGISMINHILRNLKKLANKINIKQILIVVGKYRSQIQESIEDTRNLTYINQSEALGTGHAVQCCLGELIKYPNTNTLILSGDVPMFSANSMLSLLNKLDKARIMITTNNNPTDYGRIIIQNFKKLLNKMIVHTNN